MIRWLGAKISYFFSASLVKGRIRSLERKIEKAGEARLLAERRLDAAERAMTSAHSQMEAALLTARQGLLQYEATLEEARSQAAVREGEIELLEAAHQKQLQRLKADTAVDVQRQALFQRPRQTD